MFFPPYLHWLQISTWVSKPTLFYCDGNVNLNFRLKYIAGVFDPDLKKASQHWDLLCNIDDGTVTWNSSVDGTFIQEAKEQEPFFKKIHDKIFLGCGEVTAQKALQVSIPM